jgi:hypothetical protein
MGLSGRSGEVGEVSPGQGFSWPWLARPLCRNGVFRRFLACRVEPGVRVSVPFASSFPDARLAQLVERRPYKANVGGSIPSARTI